MDLCNCWHFNNGLRGKVPLNFVFFDREIATKEVAERFRWMRRLIDRGHLDQIAISHDIYYMSYITSRASPACAYLRECRTVDATARILGGGNRAHHG